MNIDENICCLKIQLIINYSNKLIKFISWLLKEDLSILKDFWQEFFQNHLEFFSKIWRISKIYSTHRWRFICKLILWFVLLPHRRYEQCSWRQYSKLTDKQLRFVIRHLASPACLWTIFDCVYRWIKDISEICTFNSSCQ